MYQTEPKPSFKNAAKLLTPNDIAKAEHFWIIEAQKTMQGDIKWESTNACAQERMKKKYT